jgi:hypothetical protein
VPTPPIAVIVFSLRLGWEVAWCLDLARVVSVVCVGLGAGCNSFIPIFR